MRWNKRRSWPWAAGVLAGLMLALTAMSQTATPPPAQPKTAPPTAQSAPAPQAPAQQTPTAPAMPPQQAPALPAPAPPATPPTEAEPAPHPAPPPSRVAIVLDPSHGGDERGAALSDKLNEKDVVLSLARRVRAELTRAGVPVTMLRDSDITLDTDQRAQMANASRPLLYVALHASSIGTGLRIYTTVLPELQPAPGSLVRWQRAQQDWLDASHAAAESIAADLDERQVSATTLATALPPLNSVTAAAIAVEVAPPPGGRATADMLSSGQYQQRVAAALAAALANVRRKIGAPSQPAVAGPGSKTEAPQ